MSFLINSNKVMKINEENETLKSVLNDYLKYMTDFDCFSINTESHGKGFIEVSTHIDDESFNYNDELEHKLFEAVKESNDGSFAIEMSTSYDGTKVTCCGNVKLEKVSLDDISDETEWFTGVVPKIVISSATVVNAEELFGGELSELFDYDDIVDEYEEDGQRCAVYHMMDDWCNLNKISIFELSQLISKAHSRAKAAGVSISLAEDCRLFVTEACSSYLEIDIDDNGNLITEVSRLKKI